MARGGKRLGAGRRPGSASKRTREIADKAAAEGMTPLEVMLRAMKEHAEALRWDQAASVAKDAAPYIHPRLAAIEHAGPGGGPMQAIGIGISTSDPIEAAKVYQRRRGDSGRGRHKPGEACSVCLRQYHAFRFTHPPPQPRPRDQVRDLQLQAHGHPAQHRRAEYADIIRRPNHRHRHALQQAMHEHARACHRFVEFAAAAPDKQILRLVEQEQRVPRSGKALGQAQSRQPLDVQTWEILP